VGIEEKTIRDFGEQWQTFRENTGYYASLDIFKDIVGPLVDIEDIKGKVVADVGSGTGRVVNMLADAGAEHIVAIEPSSSFPILKQNTDRHHKRITYLNISGHELTSEDNFDHIFSLGVLHHIYDPAPCLKACYRALKRGGRIVIWLYGFEGNGLYLFWYHAVCRITRSLPHWALMIFCRLLRIPIVGYGHLAKLFRLPMHEYFKNHYLRIDRRAQLATLYDQLNPAYAKYYRKSEALGLLETAGFQNIRIYHRHGYSWTLTGEKL
jgi:ubiquinone/menaquinone biosynthesis C-methylase UbiE